VRNIALTSFALLFLAYAAFSIPLILRFRKWCDSVALATNRTDENASVKAQDESGGNAFHREQLRVLRTGEYTKLQEPNLVQEGHVLSKRIRLMYLLAVALVISFALIDITTR
jgi:hypothetical protein